MTTPITIQSLIDTSKDMDTRKGDYADHTPQFVGGKMVLVDNAGNDLPIGRLNITDHALGQLCGRLGPAYYGKGSGKSAPRDSFRIWLDDEKFAPFASGLLNEGVERANARWFVRTYEDTARAILSDRYAPIQNTDLLTKLAEAFGVINANASTPVNPELYRTTLSPDRVDLRFRIMGRAIMPQGEGTPYGLGGYISNDEVGSGSMKVLPAIWRGSCDNTFTWASTKEDNTAAVNVRHVGSGVVLADRMAAAIAHCIALGGKMLEQFMYSKAIEIPDIAKMINDMAKGENWSTEFVSAALVGTEGQQNLYGLVNGATWAAHTVYANDPVRMAEIEARAGSWVMEPALVGLKSAADSVLVVEN